jgi:hypothetical protein
MSIKLWEGKNERAATDKRRAMERKTNAHRFIAHRSTVRIYFTRGQTLLTWSAIEALKVNSSLR